MPKYGKIATNLIWVLVMLVLATVGTRSLVLTIDLIIGEVVVIINIVAIIFGYVWLLSH